MTEKETNAAAIYSTQQFAKISGRDERAIKKAIKNKIVIPDDIIPSKGRYGFTYAFSEQTIRDYCTRLGLEPDFDAISDPLKLRRLIRGQRKLSRSLKRLRKNILSSSQQAFIFFR